MKAPKETPDLYKFSSVPVSSVPLEKNNGNGWNQLNTDSHPIHSQLTRERMGTHGNAWERMKNSEESNG